MHNNQYSRGYGYNEQSTSSLSSSRSSDRINDRFNSWHKEPEWSGRDESWRGNSRPVAPPDRGRNDSWKTASASPTTLGFQLGRDRAPMPVDDQFLIRYGAKRLSNGNLVDRDGYTLRTRDPNCRAFQPSPPAFNPGREMRRNGDNGRDRGGPPSPNRSSGGSWERMRPDEDLEKFQKARQQIEMMEKLEEESKKAAEKRMIEKRKAKEKEKRKEKDGEDEWEEPEGQDEYEDVVEEPPEKKEAKNIPPFTKSPLLPNPPPFLSGGPRFNGPTYQKAKPAPRPDSWFSQYKKNVEAFKEQLYRAPPAAPGYYPNDRHPSSSSLSTPSGSSPAFPRTSASPSTSSPYPAQPRRQMDLPPPGVVEFDPVYSKRSPRYTGVDHGRIATASTSSAYPMAVNAFGVYIGNQNPPPTSSQPAPRPSTNRRDSPSSDSGSGSEDEAIRKLREIIKNYGSRT